MNDEYVYYSPMRPPTLGSVPKAGLLYVEVFTQRRYVADIDGMAWGWAVYKQPLAPAEVAEYELIAKPNEVQR